MNNVTNIIKSMMQKWEELSPKYGGELEVDYEDGKYYACAFHNEPCGNPEYDSWVERIKEIDCLGSSPEIERICNQFKIPVCH